MAMIATTAQPACRKTKCQPEWKRGSICAMMLEALYRITIPNDIINSTVPNRIQSVLSLWPISTFLRQCVHQLLENFAAVLVVLELVEAGARRGEQNGIARVAVLEPVCDGRIERLHVHQRRRTLQRAADLARRGADQKGGMRLGGQRLAQQRIIQTLVLPAQDDPKAAGERIDRFQGRIHAGGFRVVV